MPLAIFFMTVLLSLVLSLSMFSIISDSVKTATLDQSASFLSAQSDIGFQWGNISPAYSVGVLQKQAFNFSSDMFPALSYQQGLDILPKNLSKSSDLSFPVFFDKSSEILLYDVIPEENVDWLALDACRVDDGNKCPELIFEWFRFRKGFRFQSLQMLNDSSFDKNLQDNCVDLHDYGLQRCVLRSSSSSGFSDLMRSPPSLDFQERWRLRVSLAGYHYLFRVRSLDHSSFSFRWFAVMGGVDGEEAFPPSSSLRLSTISQARLSRSQIQERRQFSTGLQDSLSFVHYSYEVDDK